jgi:hypothetical protein
MGLGGHGAAAASVDGAAWTGPTALGRFRRYSFSKVLYIVILI